MNLGIEDETLEFKKTTNELDVAMNSICAILNKHGKGTLYFGVLPSGEICGQTVTESTLRDVSRKIYESIEPRIVPKIEKRMYEDKAVIEVTFYGNNRPYSSKGIYYIRTADEDRVLPPHELRQLFEYNKNSSWDKQLTAYTLSDIDLASFEKFYKRATACGRLDEQEYKPETILTKLGLLVNGNLTNAAYYLFANSQPIVLKMAVFATDEKLTFIDINRVKGNIIDLIDKAYTYVKENIRWKADIVGLNRIETPEIPVKALREIICNSFAHARYNASTEHEIDIHPGKVVIYNPGEFPIGYKPEDFVNEDIQSMVRNPLILDTLYLSDDVESYSSGLRKVYRECGEYGVGIDYQIRREGFAFIFKRASVVNADVNNVVNSDVNVVNNVANQELTESEKCVLDFLKEEPYISAASIAEKIGKSHRTIQRIINSLKSKGAIERIGGTKGYWKVIK